MSISFTFPLLTWAKYQRMFFNYVFYLRYSLIISRSFMTRDRSHLRSVVNSLLHNYSPQAICLHIHIYTKLKHTYIRIIREIESANMNNQDFSDMVRFLFSNSRIVHIIWGNFFRAYPFINTLRI